MRKSINISQNTKKLISTVKQMKYPNARITDSYVINEAIKCSGYEILEKKISYSNENKKYQSVKYTLDYRADDIISKLMNNGFTADSIIRESLEQMQRLELYKRRAKFFENKSSIKLFGTNGCKVNLINFLPVIYSISLSNGKMKEVLYVGKSKLFDKRKSTHIVSVFDDPLYFGLDDDDLFNDKLSLIFNIEEVIDVLNCDNMSQFEKLLTDKETETIERLNPITQCGKNMIKDQEMKRKIVKETINKLLNND